MAATSDDFERISPTAKLAAFWRKDSGLPYSQDIADLFHVEDSIRSHFHGLQGSQEVLTSYAELRYKSIEALLHDLGIKQVLEFASGISLRGLAMTEDPIVTYVETDLPALTEEKSRILRKIMQRYGIMRRQNLHIRLANILVEADIEPLLSLFRPREPVAVVHEGLMEYLNIAERRTAARHIRKVLERFGGVWVTPDFDTKTSFKDTNFNKTKFRPFIDSLAQTTGRSLVDNAFADDDALVEFLTNEGFEVEVQPQLSARTELSHYRDRPMPEGVRNALRQMRLWILRCSSC